MPFMNLLGLSYKRSDFHFGPGHRLRTVQWIGQTSDEEELRAMYDSTSSTLGLLRRRLEELGVAGYVSPTSTTTTPQAGPSDAVVVAPVLTTALPGPSTPYSSASQDVRDEEDINVDINGINLSRLPLFSTLGHKPIVRILPPDAPSTPTKPYVTKRGRVCTPPQRYTDMGSGKKRKAPTDDKPNEKPRARKRTKRPQSKSSMPVTHEHVRSIPGSFLRATILRADGTPAVEHDQEGRLRLVRPLRDH